MRNQKCKNVDETIVSQEPNKAMNETYETLRVKLRPSLSAEASRLTMLCG